MIIVRWTAQGLSLDGAEISRSSSLVKVSVSNIRTAFGNVPLTDLSNSLLGNMKNTRCNEVTNLTKVRQLTHDPHEILVDKMIENVIMMRPVAAPLVGIIHNVPFLISGEKRLCVAVALALNIKAQITDLTKWVKR